MKTVGEYISEGLLKRGERLPELNNEIFKLATEWIEKSRMYIGDFMKLLHQPDDDTFWDGRPAENELDKFILHFIHENFRFEKIYDEKKVRRLSPEKRDDFYDWLDQLWNMGIAVMDNAQIHNMLMKHPWNMYNVFRKNKDLKKADYAMFLGEADGGDAYIVYTTVPDNNKAKVELANTIFRNLY